MEGNGLSGDLGLLVLGALLLGWCWWLVMTSPLVRQLRAERAEARRVAARAAAWDDIRKEAHR